MIGEIPAYQKGLENTALVAADRKAATTKAPEGRLELRQQNIWIPDCREFKHDPDLSITYLKHKKLSQGQADIDKAIAYLQQAPTGIWLLGELRNQLDVMVGVHFFAASADYPWQGDVTPNESGHTKLMSSAAAPVVLYWVSVFTAGRTPECIADTLFHELLHVWFLATRSGHNETLGTGHEPNAVIAIGEGCKKIYTGFDPAFESKLKAFDNDLTQNIPGATRCCA